MTPRPAQIRVGSAITAAALTIVGCGWGRDIGAGSRTDGRNQSGSVDDTTPPDVDDHDPMSASVNRIVDGDSVELTIEGVDVEFRLEGYNAPELYTDNADGADSQTCNGLAARSALDGLVASAESIEVIERGTDRFGRTLGDLLIDGESVVDRLVVDGLGLATGDDEDRRGRMVEAASAGVGVWGDGCGLSATDDLRIGGIQVDAPGNDRSNLAEEYVEVVNTGSGPIELAGWVLRDDTTGHRFPLPGTLAAGERLTVITGAGPSDQVGVHHLDESFAVWSNDWETVILVDPDGVFADWRFVEDGRVLIQ